MYVLLRADQRLKQNHEDVLLLAHLQELYLSVKDLGLMLSHPKITQVLLKETAWKDCPVQENFYNPMIAPQDYDVR